MRRSVRGVFYDTAESGAGAGIGPIFRRASIREYYQESSVRINPSPPHTRINIVSLQVVFKLPTIFRESKRTQPVGGHIGLSGL